MVRATRTGSGDRSYRLLVPAVGAYSTVATTVGFLAPLLLAMADDLGVSPAEVGQLVVVTALPWALLAPFCGLLSDRLGRRPVLLVALVGMGLSTIAGAFVSDIRALVALRLLTGAFGSGGPPTIMAGLVEYYPPHQRGRVIGWTNSSFSIAALVGVPLVGAVGGAWGWRASFVVVGLGLLAGALALWLSYPHAPPGVGGGGNPLQAYRHLLGRPHLATLLLSNLSERIAFTPITEAPTSAAEG